ncbi:MAG: hypothetical protein QOG65_1094, partial [Actinomycetota bacterium]|nr:hypothetical protein [Actinomycetota bacterium]
MSKRTTNRRPNRAKTPPPRKPALAQTTAADAPLGARLGVKIAAFVTLVVVCATAGVAYVI